MTNPEAKFTLGAYRANGQDAGDPAFAEALAQAKQDPALGAWLARAQAHDAAVGAKLREVMPPATLRAAILAGARASTAPRPWWRQPVWLAAAAAGVMLLSVAVWRFTPVRGETMAEFAVNAVRKDIGPHQHGGEVAGLRTWLGEQHGPLPEVLPAKFAELRSRGCRTLAYKGQDVSLVCFERGGQEYHVLVARLDPATDASGPGLRLIDRGDLVAATWADTTHRYVLVGDAGLAALKQLL
jgi:hypothetical protein